MLVLWKVQLADSGFGGNDLCLHCQTETIEDPIRRYQIELLASLDRPRNKKLSFFRSSFAPLESDLAISQGIRILRVDDYWEDSAGNVLTQSQAMKRLCNLREEPLLFVSRQPHWMALQIAIANGEPLFGSTPPAFSSKESHALKQFATDTALLARSRFASQGFSWPRSDNALSNEHLTAFVAMFRRVYAANEPGSWNEVSRIVMKHCRTSPFATWLDVEQKELADYLDAKASAFPFQQSTLSFTNKCLINSFVNQKYMHQPKPSNEAARVAMAYKTGGLDRLEACFWWTAIDVSCRLITWGMWIRKLCDFSGLDLTVDSMGMPMPDHIERRPPESALPAEERRAFEHCALELAWMLRDLDSDKSKKTVVDYVEEAKTHLRAVL